MRVLAGAVLIVCLSGAAGCSFIVDTRIDQCSSDSECAVVGGICNLATQLCVVRPPATASDRDGGVALDSADPETEGSGDAGMDDAGGPTAPDDGSTADAQPSETADDVASAAADARPSCDNPQRPIVRIEGEITASDTLGCDRLYLLVGPVLVRPGTTLTILPGTTILGDGPSKGTLVIQPGARLIADGQRDAPIVFTSAQPPADRKPGDWGGVLLLGRAPTNAATPTIEGITQGGEYGGTDENDDSGVLRFVRIEYSGTRLGPNNEINGLTLGGVGRKTIIDHVQVRQTTDDCFEFFGGTVDARHLICQGNGDDGFDWDNGYRGRLQFLVLQQDVDTADQTNGFEGDNNALGTGATPITEPTVYNATLCGRPRDVEEEQYAILLRRGARAHIYNTVATGFEAGLDVRDSGTALDLASSVFWNNHVRLVGYEENRSNLTTQRDDDGGMDENRYFYDPARRNAAGDPALGDCFDRTTLALRPASAVTRNARQPPDDGFFDPQAAFLGAFRDRSDEWATGAWVVWAAR